MSCTQRVDTQGAVPNHDNSRFMLIRPSLIHRLSPCMTTMNSKEGESLGTRLDPSLAL